MAHKTLRRLVWRQHWSILLLILIGLVGSAAVQSLYGSQAWHTQSDPRLIDSQVQYRRKHHDYVDSVGKRYSSKQAFLKDYQERQLQVYRQQPTKKTKTIRGNFGTKINQYYFVIGILAGTVMIWYARRRYLNEFLQTLGYRRSEIYRQQWLQYGLTVVSGVVMGSLVNLAILRSQIPASYFTYFKWQAWLQDLMGDAVVALCVFAIASLATVVINNVIVAGALTLSLYLYWWMPQSVWQNATTAIAANYLSRHWGLGCVLALLIIGITWGLAQWLVSGYSAEQRSQFVVHRSLRLILLLIMSVPLGVILSRIFRGFILSNTSWPSLVLGWILGLVVLTVWIYRPKWSRRLWELMGQLR